jgi:hypothetical protein
MAVWRASLENVDHGFVHERNSAFAAVYERRSWMNFSFRCRSWTPFMNAVLRSWTKFFRSSLKRKTFMNGVHRSWTERFRSWTKFLRSSGFSAVHERRSWTAFFVHERSFLRSLPQRKSFMNAVHRSWTGGVSFMNEILRSSAFAAVRERRSWTPFFVRERERYFAFSFMNGADHCVWLLDNLAERHKWTVQRGNVDSSTSKIKLKPKFLCRNF